MTFLYDILIVLILAFFAWRGAKKGLILSLCALLSLFVAFFGARLVTNQFHQPVAEILEPPIYQSILNLEREDQESTVIHTDSNSMEELLDKIRSSDRYSGLADFLEDAAEDGSMKETSADSAAKAVSGYLSVLIAKAGLFSITFLLIVLVWFLVSRLLDLTFKLPGLSTLNWIGGLVLGLVKAVLLLMVLVWIAQICGLIPNPPETPITSLFTPKRLFALLNSLIA